MIIRTNILSILIKKILQPILIAIAIAFTLVSCKKMDYSDRYESNSNYFKFFHLPDRSSVPLQRIVSNLKDRESQVSFVTNFIRNQGYPLWGYAKFKVRSIYNSAQPESDTIVSIPIVEEGTNYVKSILSVKLNGEIWYKLMEGVNFEEFGFGPDDLYNNFDALDFTVQLAILESEIFGEEIFLLQDIRIAPSIPELQGKPAIYMLIEHTSTCTRVSFGTFNGTDFDWHLYKEVCNNDEPNNEQGELEHTLELPELGGGGGGGGGWSSQNTECERSIIRVSFFDNEGQPQVSCPLELTSLSTDSLPGLYSRSIERGIDSAWSWGMSNNFREMSFIIVRKNGLIYPTNFTPGTPDKVRVDYSLELGEELLGYFHTHVVDNDYRMRSFFSDDDFWEFHKNAHQIENYTMILECGNKRFAVVVDDINKYNSFMNLTRKKQIKQLYIENHILPNQPTYTTNGQLASINASIAFFGSSDQCGLSFYEASEPDKNNFIKLNP